MTNPYNKLNVPKSASQEDIKSAYRKLAKKYHPDFHPNDPENEKQFKAITQAYEILGDKKKRGKFDRGEIDGSGNEKSFFNQNRQNNQSNGQANKKHSFGQGFENADIFSNIFGDMFSQNKKPSPKPPTTNQEMSLALTFEEAALGVKKKVKCPSGKIVELTIKPSSISGVKLKVPRQGTPGPNGHARDLIIILNVKNDNYFKREEYDVHTELPISLAQAVLGGKIKVKTIDGVVSILIKPHSNTDQIMRLKDRGIPHSTPGKRGHHFVKLKIKLEDPYDPTLEKFVKKHYSHS